MSLAKRMLENTERIAKRKPKKGGYKVDVESSGKLFGQWTFEMQRKTMPLAVAAAAEVVRQAAKERLKGHRSIETGTRKGWSKEIARIRSARTEDLYQSIHVKTINYRADGIAIAMVGPRIPDGSHGALIEYGGFSRVHWGKYGGQVAAPMPFLRPAAAETQPQQDAAMLKVVRDMQGKV